MKVEFKSTACVILIIFAMTNGVSSQLVNFQQQPSGTENVVLLNNSVILLKAVCLSVLRTGTFYGTLLSSLVTDGCPSLYANVFRTYFHAGLSIEIGKLNDVKNILYAMTQISLASQVQNYTDRAQEQDGRINKISTYADFLKENNEYIRLNNDTLSILIPQLTDFVKRNSSGLEGAVPCVCVNQTLNAIDAQINNIGRNTSQNAVSDILNPPSDPTQVSFNQLKDAFNTVNDSFAGAIGLMVTNKDMLPALNSPDPCGSDYRQFFITFTLNFLTTGNARIALLINLTTKLNITDSTNDLQAANDRFAILAAQLGNSSISNSDLTSGYKSFVDLIEELLNTTFVNLKTNIDKRIKTPNDCVCLSSISRTLLTIVVPLLTKLSGTNAQIVGKLLKTAILTGTPLDKVLNQIRSLLVGIPGILLDSLNLGKK